MSCIHCLLHSLSRALLRNPSLLLCDEVTSSVDALSEQEIIDTLRRMSDISKGIRVGEGECMLQPPDHTRSDAGQQGRTIITVAHRLSSIAHCDRIIVLEQGRVVEQGTHRDLLAIPNGVYRSMWEAQNSRFYDHEMERKRELVRN